MNIHNFADRERKILVVSAAIFVGLGISALVRDGSITGAFWLSCIAANAAGFLAASARKATEVRITSLRFKPATILFFLMACSLLYRTSAFEYLIAADIEQGHTVPLHGALLLGADRNAAVGPLKRPLLGVAVDRKQIPATQILLHYGADPNRADKHGWTPLMIARYRGDERMADLLLRYGASERPLPVLPKTRNSFFH